MAYTLDVCDGTANSLLNLLSAKSEWPKSTKSVCKINAIFSWAFLCCKILLSGSGKDKQSRRGRRSRAGAEAEPGWQDLALPYLSKVTTGSCIPSSSWEAGQCPCSARWPERATCTQETQRVYSTIPQWQVTILQWHTLQEKSPYTQILCCVLQLQYFKISSAWCLLLESKAIQYNWNKDQSLNSFITFL